MTDPAFTTIDLLRSEGIEITPPLSWTLGTALREAYQRETGELPEKQLRRKTDGTGSHCFAIYPARFRPEALRIVRQIVKATQAEEARQGRLL
jgi:hypothetical protein